MKIVRLITSLILIFSFYSCSSIKSNDEISLIKKADTHKLIITYDTRQYEIVKLDNIVIDSGVEYYVKSGNYILSYLEKTFFTGEINMSWSKNNKKISNNRKNMTRKNIKIDKDMQIELQNHSVNINVLGSFNKI